MNRLPKLVLVLAVLCAGCGAPKSAQLDPAGFIAGGNAFLKGIMHGDYEATYAQCISPGAKYNPQLSLAHFTADWQAIVEKFGAIQKAELTAYQLVPGRRVGQLYYRVAHEKAGAVDYHLVLEMDGAGHATVFLMDIGNTQAYPAAGNPGAKQAPAAKVEVLP